MDSKELFDHLDHLSERPLSNLISLENGHRVARATEPWGILCHSDSFTFCKFSFCLPCKKTARNSVCLHALR